MAGDQPVSWLMFFTFAATIFIIAAAFILRSRRNRDIAADALAGGDHPRVNKGADGALPDLLGVYQQIRERFASHAKRCQSHWSS